ncbi:hypothetical protein G5C51_39230 [Streptomyces sp. A7024]|uniref:DUF1269 domain-containing family protein n=1 Tax=Streptomyces coryli TaxID=1128680 RepID=A0A6G4UCG5_9ACTN|nr:DUF6325 family protein [Streptomyces coryli]NGN69909.1 hypothetical protein [Streptomyces coryli]
MPSGLKADSVGPVDVAVVAFDGNQFNGDVAPALRELQESGVVRFLDMTFIRKGPDGSVSVVELADSGVAEAFERVAEAEFDLLSDEDLQVAAHSLAPNSSALVACWENTWAARLATALRESKGEVLFMERVPRDDVARAITALDEE